ncbi:MAG TPA: glycyl-radical enzyme activating protein [Candidatus Alectryocaccomicrobium excrementavium]|uniref:Glycyl-radical enzyme activating protein n=1 Tax=Candidatus Alectryocaccomicrobium excrementavium TaxID=2840668 RepID=A0A9D1G015_9FIRM|nr:glycyl-radical enzyme activating protein [Candidatus Alectryocaccomicrobium excrementavium]
MEKGILFNVQRFSVHDGPGIRTTLFFKGCPLRCQWCHNPEGYRQQRELSFQSAKCIGCGACLAACPSGAHASRDGAHVLLREKCTACGACASACPTGALSILGEIYTAGQAAEAALRDAPFYADGGGATLSGGEPMAQPEFALAIARILREKGVSVCVETSGHCPPAALQAIVPYVQCFLFDIKETDPARHKAFTGVDNARILENFRLLDRLGAQTVLRCPIIPGVNDRPEHFLAIAALANEARHVSGIELEPYHPLGLSKREQLGQPGGYALRTSLAPEALEPFLAQMRAHTDVPVRIS